MSAFIRNSGNVLIQKDNVGVPKPCHKNLPPEGFVYGKSCGYDPEGAKEITMTWKFHSHTRNKRAQTDFKKLNKMCIK